LDKKKSCTRFLTDFDNFNLEDAQLALRFWLFEMFPDDSDLRKTVTLIERQSFRPSVKNIKFCHVSHKLCLLGSLIYGMIMGRANAHCLLMNASTVKECFGTATGKHYTNKKESLRYCEENWSISKDNFPSWDNHQADALIQLMAYVQLYIVKPMNVKITATKVWAE
jgi:hypothetical protein